MGASSWSSRVTFGPELAQGAGGTGAGGRLLTGVQRVSPPPLGSGFSRVSTLSVTTTSDVQPSPL